jgi:hypothetical protein
MRGNTKANTQLMRRETNMAAEFIRVLLSIVKKMTDKES